VLVARVRGILGNSIWEGPMARKQDADRGGIDAETLRTLVLEAFRDRPESMWQRLQVDVARIAGERGCLPSKEECAALKLQTEYYERGRLNPMDLKPLMWVVWSLIGEGILMPASASNGWPGIEVTPYGQDVLDGLEPSPYDPEGYLNDLDERVPGLDDTARLYVEQALGCFRHGLHIPAMVMIGVAVERALLVLADGLVHWLPANDAKAIVRERKDNRTAKLAEVILKRLEDRKRQLPPELRDASHPLLFLAAIVRKTRNDAGHPTGFQTDRKTVLVHLTTLPSYLEFAYAAADWMGKQPPDSG